MNIWSLLEALTIPLLLVAALTFVCFYLYKKTPPKKRDTIFTIQILGFWVLGLINLMNSWDVQKQINELSTISNSVYRQDKENQITRLKVMRNELNWDKGLLYEDLSLEKNQDGASSLKGIPSVKFLVNSYLSGNLPFQVMESDREGELILEEYSNLINLNQGLDFLFHTLEDGSMTFDSKRTTLKAWDKSFYTELILGKSNFDESLKFIDEKIAEAEKE
jgi:hypothetical protein